MAHEPILQMRPRGTDQGSYSPIRDIVWLFPQLMGIAQQSLEWRHLEPWLQDLAGQHGVDEADLAQAFHRLALAATEIPRLVNDHPDCSLDANAFFAAAPVAKLVVYARLGMASLCAYHKFLRQSYTSPVDAIQHVKALSVVEEGAARFLSEAKGRDR